MNQSSTSAKETGMANRAGTRKLPTKIGYARVSTKDQTLDLQIDALKKAGCIKVLTEVMSGGAAAERPVLQNLLEQLRAGDVLMVWKLDRLGRSLQHLIATVNDLLARQVDLKREHQKVGGQGSPRRLGGWQPQSHSNA
jgi:DNA invertase Pin-like site-specific DNA recombinase